jgi:signal transduction histidine kinase
MRIAEVVDSATETLRDRARRAGVALTVDCDVAGSMQGDPEKLRRVVINLVGNALEALEGARVEAPRVSVQAGENLAGTEVWVRVEDNGPGIEPERLARIFSPFYTSKDSGTGLGLALSRKVVTAHGGSIEAEPSPGGGTRFLVTLPKRPAAAADVERP